jgi:hypothetical protein
VALVDGVGPASAANTNAAAKGIDFVAWGGEPLDEALIRGAHRRPESIKEFRKLAAEARRALKSADPSVRERIREQLRVIGDASGSASDKDLLDQVDAFDAALMAEEGARGAGLRSLGIDLDTPIDLTGLAVGRGRSIGLAKPKQVSYNFQLNRADYVAKLNHFQCSKTCNVDATVTFRGSLFPYYNSFAVHNESIIGDPDFYNLSDAQSCGFNFASFCGQTSFSGYGQNRWSNDYVSGSWNGGNKTWYNNLTGSFLQWTGSANQDIGPAGCQSGGTGAEVCRF